MHGTHPFTQVIPLRFGILEVKARLLVLLNGQQHFTQEIIVTKCIVIPDCQPQSPLEQVIVRNLVLDKTLDAELTIGLVILMIMMCISMHHRKKSQMLTLYVNIAIKFYKIRSNAKQRTLVEP